MKKDNWHKTPNGIAYYKEYRRKNRKKQKAYSKKYQADNAEILSLKAKLYRLENKEKSRARRKLYYQRNKIRIKAQSAKQRTSSAYRKYQESYKYKYAILRHRAKKHGIPLSFSREEYRDFVRKYPKCYYCGGPRPRFGTGLDRIDNDLGYQIDNIVSCCEACNKIKGQFLNFYEMVHAMLAVIKYRKDRDK